jgi:uncharacterized membrane protein YccC
MFVNSNSSLCGIIFSRIEEVVDAPHEEDKRMHPDDQNELRSNTLGPANTLKYDRKHDENLSDIRKFRRLRILSQQLSSRISTVPQRQLLNLLHWTTTAARTRTTITMP